MQSACPRLRHGQGVRKSPGQALRSPAVGAKVVPIDDVGVACIPPPANVRVGTWCVRALGETQVNEVGFGVADGDVAKAVIIDVPDERHRGWGCLVRAAFDVWAKENDARQLLRTDMRQIPDGVIQVRTAKYKVDDTQPFSPGTI